MKGLYHVSLRLSHTYNAVWLTAVCKISRHVHELKT